MKCSHWHPRAHPFHNPRRRRWKPGSPRFEVNCNGYFLQPPAHHLSKRQENLRDANENHVYRGDACSLYFTGFSEAPAEAAFRAGSEHHLLSAVSGRVAACSSFLLGMDFQSLTLHFGFCCLPPTFSILCFSKGKIKRIRNVVELFLLPLPRYSSPWESHSYRGEGLSSPPPWKKSFIPEMPKGGSPRSEGTPESHTAFHFTCEPLPAPVLASCLILTASALPGPPN